MVFRELVALAELGPELLHLLDILAEAPFRQARNPEDDCRLRRLVVLDLTVLEVGQLPEGGSGLRGMLLQHEALADPPRHRAVVAHRRGVFPPLGHDPQRLLAGVALLGDESRDGFHIREVENKSVLHDLRRESCRELLEPLRHPRDGRELILREACQSRCDRNVRRIPLHDRTFLPV